MQGERAESMREVAHWCWMLRPGSSWKIGALRRPVRSAQTGTFSWFLKLQLHLFVCFHYSGSISCFLPHILPTVCRLRLDCNNIYLGFVEQQYRLMLPLWVFLMHAAWCKIEVLGSQGVWCSGRIEHFLLSGIVQPVSPPFSALGCSSCTVLHFCVGVWRDTNTEPNAATLSPQGHYCQCGCSSSEYCCSASSLLRSLHDTVTEPENSFKMKLLLDVGILFHLVLCSLWVIHPLPPNHKGWGMRRLYSHKSTPFLWMNITGIVWTEQPAWKWKWNFCVV